MDERPVCPSCGRNAVATAPGQCIYCLKRLPGYESRIEPGKILRLSELDQMRGQARRAGWGRRMRAAGAVGVGVLAAGILVGLFGLCLRWVMGFVGRGVAVGK